MKQFVSIVFFIISVNYQMIAQVSGYQGKRVIANYSILFFNSLSNPDEQNITTFNSKHNFSVDYLVDRYTSIGISTELYKTKIPVIKHLIKYNVVVKNSGDTTTKNFYPSQNVNLSAYNIGLFIKFYQQSDFAPIGTYHQASISRIFYKVDISAGTFDIYDDSYDTIFPPDIPIDDSYGATLISYTLGNQRVYFDRLLLDIGLQTGWVFGGKILELLLSDVDAALDNNQYIELSSKRRLLGHHFFNIKIGIGFLLY